MAYANFSRIQSSEIRLSIINEDRTDRFSVLKNELETFLRLFFSQLDCQKIVGKRSNEIIIQLREFFPGKIMKKKITPSIDLLKSLSVFWQRESKIIFVTPH